MPYRDPDPTDPMRLVGVTVPAGTDTVREMAAAFADEFGRMGFDRDRILALFRSPFYAGAHAALHALGEAEIGRLVDESLGRWSHCRYVVEESTPGAGRDGDLRGDATGPAAEDESLVGPDGFLKMVR